MWKQKNYKDVSTNQNIVIYSDFSMFYYEIVGNSVGNVQNFFRSPPMSNTSGMTP